MLMDKFAEEYGRNKREQLTRCIPDIYGHKSLLYIGAAVLSKWPKGMIFLPEFMEVGYRIDILEAWPPLVEKLRKMNSVGIQYPNALIGPSVFNKIVQGDVREMGRLIADNYDVTLWYHGPEHIRSVELEKTLDKILLITKKIAVIGCPYGIYHQGPQYGNPLEVHISHHYPERYKALGWETDTIGEKDNRGNLLAWSRISE